MIAAGLGCRAGCPPADIILALTRAVEQQGFALADVQALFSSEVKGAEDGLRRAAEQLGKPLVLLPHKALAAQAGGALTTSAAVTARFELPSVAETAALAGALALAGGSVNVRLLAPRQVAGGAACALARAVPAAATGATA
jgi:cobalt-precorrin 5A hydrolase